MAVRVAKRLADKFSDFEMVMAGKEGPLLHTAIDLAKEYGLEKKIFFAGYINMQQKLNYAKVCDIYICTNKIDNTPVSLTEFMQLGLPVVAVNTGGIPYMIEDGVNGLLVNTNDDEAMCNKIELLVNNQLLAQTIIINAYNYVQRYNEKNVIQKWKPLLAEYNS
jgi:glycosyltransferase involved in cell wall biosynthesis